MRHLFISRERSFYPELANRLKEKDVNIIAKSLIETISVESKESLPACDWIFFSSRNAARCFKLNYPDIPNAKLAAMGAGSASELKDWSFEFLGKGMNTVHTAELFARVCRDEKVLFPVSNVTARTVQKALNPEQVVELQVYETKLLPVEIEPCDIYIFTAASNVRSFFLLNKIKEGASVWGAGTSTQNELLAQGVKNPKVLDGLTEYEVIQTIL